MIYLDNAATTITKPSCVIKANDYAVRSLCANAGRGSHSAAMKAASVFYEARKAVKALTACDETVFCFNCTDALNTAIFGSARRGHIITTAFDHNSVLRPIYELSRRKISDYTVVFPNAQGVIDPADIERAIRPDTYLIAINHVSNVLGAVAPVSQIGNIAHRHGITYLVDGAQSVGYMDVNMREIGCDMLCFSPHKGLHGPQGIGCLCLRDGIKLAPHRFGGTGTASDSLAQPADIPEGLESGTMPVNCALSLIAAIHNHMSATPAARRKLAALGDDMRERLQKIRGVRLYGKYNILPTIACFNIQNVNSAIVGDILNEQYDIAVRCGLHCAPLCHKYLGTLGTGAIRASLSYENTQDEVDFFIKAVTEIAM